MKLSDYKGEDSLALVSRIWEPVNEIIADDKVKEAFRGGNMRDAIKPILDGHPKAIIEIMAAIENEDPKEYAPKVNVFTLPLKLIDLFSDEEFQTLFMSQSQTGQAEPSGSATESTGGSDK